jgi:hypothetical protein
VRPYATLPLVGHGKVQLSEVEPFASSVLGFSADEGGFSALGLKRATQSPRQLPLKSLPLRAALSE